MYTQGFDTHYWADLAKCFTAKSANISDWRIRSRKNKALRELAREWGEGEGYIVATEEQMYATCHWRLTHKGKSTIKDKRTHIWAVKATPHDQWGRVALNIVKVR